MSANNDGSILRCDLDGAILEILCDGLAISGLFAVGHRLDRYVAANDRLPAQAFLAAVRRNGAAFACSLTMDAHGQQRPLQFDGGKVDGTLLLIVRPADSAVLIDPVPAPRRRRATDSRNSSPPAARPFSPRECDVVTMLLEGMPNRLISERLGIEESAVKARLRSIYRKLRVTNRAQAIMAILADQQMTAIGSRALR